MAAAHSKLLPPPALLARLERPLDALTGGARDLPARQRTLRDTLAWSYDLLDHGARALFRWLAVFVGGCSLEAAAAVCPLAAANTSTVSDGDLFAFAQLSALIDQSLLRLEESPLGEPRLGMLETIREYGLECLAASGEEDAARHRHVAYYLAVAEAAEPALLGPEQANWLARLDHEHDNLRAALRWARENGDTTRGLRIAGALWRFWHIRGHLSEGRGWLDGLLADPRTDGSGEARVARAKALRSVGGLAYYQGDYGRAWALYEDFERLCRDLGDAEGRAGALHNLALVAHIQGDDERARPLLEESLALARSLEDGVSLIAAALSNLGAIARSQGDDERARPLLEESLTLRRQAGDTWGIAVVLVDLAAMACAQRDDRQAMVLYRQSLALCGTASYQWGIARCLEGIAGVAALREQPCRAARLLGAAAAVRLAAGTPLPPDERPDYDRAMATARATLGDNAFAAAWAQGRALSAAQAVAEALDDSGERDGEAADPPSSV